VVTIMRFSEVKNQAVLEWEAMQQGDKTRILIGMATCGRAAGAEDILDTLNNELTKRDIKADIIPVGCMGLCYAEPLVEIIKPGKPSVFYGNLTPELIPEIVEDYLVADNHRPDLALGTRGEGSLPGVPRLFDLPVLKHQVRVLLRNCGSIDPKNINHYVANGGYEGLNKALKMNAQEIIDEIKNSGLRGRGGAGFPAGRKWEACYKAIGDEKYVVCNADEGDPGAFMDRSILEGDPHSVIEGMIIAGYVIRAKRGFIYVRAEYPLAIEHLQAAIAEAREKKLLGENILGSGYNFDIEIFQGAGAFVCGESTALVLSIEGKRGMPKPLPRPRTTEVGLWDKPTLESNVKTFAFAPVIISQGSEWFASIGTEGSKGTAVFSLAGKVLRTGLIEVPMGITLREIIFDIGGGIPEGKKFKAVQTGGPSGGTLTASSLDLPVDFESLSAAGSIMGSGGMLVMDEDTCMVDTARFFLSFIQDETCGKCIPCRWGTKQMLDILDDITNGKGTIEDIDLLLELSESIKNSSLCGLGQTAPNPVLTTIRYFRDEYEEHIKELHCSAAVCKGLVKAPCSHTCPANVDVPRYIRLIDQGKYDEALAVIREKIPFPAICGYACFAPCEAKCRRRELDEAISIKALKRFVADNSNGTPAGTSQAISSSGKHIAIVGSGPAGLTAAYYLAKLGHAITVFEAQSKPGGMLRFGIPRYILPEKVLDQEIKNVLSLGIELKLNSHIDKVDDLINGTFDAVFIAPGLPTGRKLPIPGADLDGVIVGLDFLRDLAAGKKVELGKRVLVLGGGGVAIDVARSALRLGVAEVHIACLESRETMPAPNSEIEAAEAEGVVIHPSRSFTKIAGNGRAVGVECVNVEWMIFDEEGKLHIETVPDSEHILEADTVIFTVGQGMDLSLVSDVTGIELTDRRTISIEPETMATGKKGVFAGGDAVSGPASIIEAIAAGRRAAASLDKYLGGKGIIDEILVPPEEITSLPETEEEEEGRYRPQMPTLAVNKRIKCFDTVELGFTKSVAIEEASRCLRCDLEED